VRLETDAGSRDGREGDSGTALEHRIFYVAKFSEAVCVLHVFEKRTRKARQADIELGRLRLREALRLRRRP